MRFNALIAWVVLSVVVFANKPGIVPFVSKTCLPCRRFDHDYRLKRTGLAAYLQANFTLKQSVDINARQDLARKYRIEGVPTFLVLADDDTVIARFSGYPFGFHDECEKALRDYAEWVASKQQRPQKPQQRIVPNDVQREVDELRRLKDENDALNRELQAELRRQHEQRQPPRKGRGYSEGASTAR